eukprot:jgi/Ulvmu1/11097/UM070_0012.1
MSDLALRLHVASARELAFIRQVQTHSDVLFDADVLKLAAARYEWLWLPFTARATGPLALEHLDAPLDIAFVWHSHVLATKEYFGDCEAKLGFVPEFSYPAPTSGAAAERWGRPKGWFHTSLPSRDVALAGMWQSLKSAIELPDDLPADSAALAAALPQSRLAIDIDSAREQLRQAFHHTSLPHYRSSYYLEQAVKRYQLFLLICARHPSAKQCPPPDIDLVWRAHLAMPKAYKAHTEGLLGEHMAHGSSRRTQPPLESLQATTERLFAAAGAQFFQPGGMFRGTPARACAAAASDLLPVAPPTAAALSVASWHCGAAPSSKDVLPCVVTGWQLQPAFKPFVLACGATPERHPVARVGEAMLMPDQISLFVRLQLAASDPAHPDRPRVSTVQCRGSVTACQLLQQGPQQPVLVSAKVKLRQSAAKSSAETIQASLQCQPVHDRIVCKIPTFAANGKGPRLESRVVSHASDHVTQPLLLLPPVAVSSVKADVAEVVSFPVYMHGMRCGSTSKVALKVKVTNTLTHMATAVEVFAESTVDGSAARLPAATAHSVNLAQLPTPALLGGEDGATLRPEAAERAIVVRSAERDEDWAVLIGLWVHDAQHAAQHGGKPADGEGGYLQWDLVLLHGAAADGAQPHLSRRSGSHFAGPSHRPGGLQKVRMDASGAQSSAALSLPHGRKCCFTIDHRRGELACDFGDGHGCESGQEAGALAALMTAVTVSVGLLHALCMPCTTGVTHPHQPLAALRQVSQGTRAPPPFPEAAPWCQPALHCLCLATNAHISKRMARAHAQAETGRITQAEADAAMQPWFGPRGLTSAGPSVDELCAVFWGGLGFEVRQFLSLKQRWAMAKPVGMPAAGVHSPGLCAARWQAGNGAGAAAESCRGPGGASGETLTVWVEEGRRGEGHQLGRTVRTEC